MNILRLFFVSLFGYCIANEFVEKDFSTAILLVIATISFIVHHAWMVWKNAVD